MERFYREKIPFGCFSGVQLAPRFTCFCRITPPQNYVHYVMQPKSILNTNIPLPVDDIHISVQKDMMESFDNVNWIMPPTQLKDGFYEGLNVNLEHLMHFTINQKPIRRVQSGDRNTERIRQQRERLHVEPLMTKEDIMPLVDKIVKGEKIRFEQIHKLALTELTYFKKAATRI